MYLHRKARLSPSVRRQLAVCNRMRGPSGGGKGSLLGLTHSGQGKPIKLGGVLGGGLWRSIVPDCAQEEAGATTGRGHKSG